MNEKSEEYKAWLAQVFDRGSDRYGQVGPDFFSYFGDKLVEQAKLVEGSTVLDVACGRVASLLPAYFRVGPSGEVIGIDLSSEMVAETQKEVEVSDLHGIRVQLMDAEDLQFPAETFDSVLCGLALFFSPMLREP
jgi:ubiquinone/menaquinone biosynthesis C-methylase UbiE